MKILGRLIMFVVGGFLLYLSISSIIPMVNTIKEIGWNAYFGQDTLKAVLTILSQVFYGLCGLYSLYLGLRGRSTFIAFVAAAILIAFVVYKTIEFAKSETPKNFETIWNLIVSYIVPIGFSFGVIFLTMERSPKNKE